MKRITWSLLWLIIACSPNQPKPAEKPFQQELSALIHTLHAQGNFDGSISIYHHRKPYFQQAVGTAQRSWDIPISTDTKFDIASISKSMIAVVLLQQASEGKISLDDTLGKWLPSFTDSSANITMHQMLTHTSGIGNYQHLPKHLKANGWRGFKRLQLSRAAMIAMIREMPLIAASGTEVNYSNFAYFLLMCIAEKVDKEPIASILSKRIFQPLGMDNSLYWNNQKQIIPKIANGYQWNEASAVFEANQYIDCSLRIPIVSTAEDLCKWGVACTNEQLLPPEYQHLLTSNHLAEMGQTYGYGWAVHPQNSSYGMGNLQLPEQSYFIHGGSMEGYKSICAVINEGEWVIAHLSNIGNKTDELGLTQKVASILYQK